MSIAEIIVFVSSLIIGWELGKKAMNDEAISIVDRFRTLRELCRREYGDEFITKYDMLNRGEPIGDIEETMAFIERVEAVKSKYGK